MKKEKSSNIFVIPNFNYCTLVWMLKNAKSVHKIEALQEGSLHFMKVPMNIY